MNISNLKRRADKLEQEGEALPAVIWLVSTEDALPRNDNSRNWHYVNDGSDELERLRSNLKPCLVFFHVPGDEVA